MFDWPFFWWNAVVIGCPDVSSWWHQWAGIPGRSSTTRLPSAPQLTPLRRWFSAYSRVFLLVQLASFVRIVSPWFINFMEIEGLATGSDVFFKIILSFIKFGDMDPSVLLRRTFSSIASFASFIKGGLCQLSFQRLHFHSSIRLGSSDFSPSSQGPGPNVMSSMGLGTKTSSLSAATAFAFSSDSPFFLCIIFFHNQKRGLTSGNLCFVHFALCISSFFRFLSPSTSFWDYSPMFVMQFPRSIGFSFILQSPCFD